MALPSVNPSSPRILSRLAAESKSIMERVENVARGGLLSINCLSQTNVISHVNSAVTATDPCRLRFSSICATIGFRGLVNSKSAVSLRYFCHLFKAR